MQQIFSKLLKTLTRFCNGLIFCAAPLLTAGLLAESYLSMPRPLLAWIAFIPFAFAILRIKTPFFSFLYAFAAGLFSYIGIIYWIYPTVEFGTGSGGLALVSLISLSAVLALQFGLFGFLCNYLKHVKWLFPISAACAWVSLELLHQFIAYKLAAFPWFVLGYTQAGATALIQISSYGGVYGVSFLIMFFSLSFAAAVNDKTPSRARLAYLIAAPLLVATAFAFGRNIIAEQQYFLNSNPQKISVALMQPDTHKLMLEGYEGEVMLKIEEQAAALGNRNIDLIIWPESSYPGSFQNKDYEDFIKQLSAKTQAVQITGSYAAQNDKDFVSAGLFDKDGLKDIYNKVKLVPFGEFLPLNDLLKSLYEKYGIASFTGTFAAGDEPGKLFGLTLPRENQNEKNFLFGAQICFESLFPSIWRAQASNGAQFFVNISNDGWFLNSAAPYQHLRANIFRSVENRRPLLRAANTGISAWIDSSGRMEYESQLGQQETAVLDFEFQPQAAKTFYTKYGDVFAYICIFITLNIFIYSAVFLDATVYHRK
ncbi:MAG: apolipoprotein N-acyltransferase [Elusimicrobiota bacterium]|jgi:apolipoprotein N-acyltransferase|nr:apolipoprotein N-acyltransferase [Elusimicrobiota bacterium]